MAAHRVGRCYSGVKGINQRTMEIVKAAYVVKSNTLALRFVWAGSR